MANEFGVSALTIPVRLGESFARLPKRPVLALLFLSSPLEPRLSASRAAAKAEEPIEARLDDKLDVSSRKGDGASPREGVGAAGLGR